MDSAAAFNTVALVVDGDEPAGPSPRAATAPIGSWCSTITTVPLDLKSGRDARVVCPGGGRRAGVVEADSDPIVGRALRLISGDPSRHWTIASLAAAAGVSRASLGRRFNDLVGEPPIAFLTSWRLAPAVDLLRAPDTTIGAVATKVGQTCSATMPTA